MGCSRQVVFRCLQDLAPSELAESWDNVGLLIEPVEGSEFQRAFFTIDLTEVTLKEAMNWGADLIVAYHPPIFSGLKRLGLSEPKERIVLSCVREGICVYSPHTALDAHQEGMTQWLAEALGAGRVTPIVPSAPGALHGAGRLVQLDQPVGVVEAIGKIKEHLGLRHVRFSRSSVDQEVSTFAVCPGAGGSVFEQLGSVDLLLTGEMRHHDVLHRQATGTHVVLTDHTNTERGFLPHFAEKVRAACPGLSVQVSQLDADPLSVR